MSSDEEECSVEETLQEPEEPVVEAPKEEKEEVAEPVKRKSFCLNLVY